MELKDAIMINNYDGIVLQEYKGTYKLVEVEKYKGKIYMKWMYPARWEYGDRVPAKKALPIQIRLGDKETAIKTLKMLLSYLEQGEILDPDEPMDEVPF